MGAPNICTSGAEKAWNSRSFEPLAAFSSVMKLIYCLDGNMSNFCMKVLSVMVTVLLKPMVAFEFIMGLFFISLGCLIIVLSRVIGSLRALTMVSTVLSMALFDCPKGPVSSFCKIVMASTIPLSALTVSSSAFGSSVAFNSSPVPDYGSTSFLSPTDSSSTSTCSAFLHVALLPSLLICFLSWSLEKDWRSAFVSTLRRLSVKMSRYYLLSTR